MKKITYDKSRGPSKFNLAHKYHSLVCTFMKGGVVSFYKIVKEGSLKKTGLQGKTLINTCSKYTENAARAC